MKYDKIETGVNLRQLRIENKLSPGEVSDIVDKSESHIMQLERGSRNLTVEMLVSLQMYIMQIPILFLEYIHQCQKNCMQN